MTKPSDKEIGEWFEQLHREHYESLIRNASIYFRAYGPSAADRAQDAVQLTYEKAWIKRDELFTKENPIAWVYGILQKTAMETYREDVKWRKQMSAMSDVVKTDTGTDFTLKIELQGLMTEEEYTLLKRVYINKETYKAISEEMNVKQSTLAMRVNRLKRRVAEDYEK